MLGLWMYFWFEWPVPTSEIDRLFEDTARFSFLFGGDEAKFQFENSENGRFSLAFGTEDAKFQLVLKNDGKFAIIKEDISR